MTTTFQTWVRWMIRRDMPQVLAVDDAWGEGDFLRCLRDRMCVGMVAGSGQTVLGFMVYRLRDDRLQLLNVAVRPAARRRGVGTVLTDKLADKLAQHRRRRVAADVPEGNLAAQLFLRSGGYRAVSLGDSCYEMTLEATPEVIAAGLPGRPNRISQYLEDVD